jgi:hypothetical protein
MGVHSEQIRAQLLESCRVKQSFSEELLARVETFAVRAAEALAAGRKLVFFGNGGARPTRSIWPLNSSCACTRTGRDFPPCR